MLSDCLLVCLFIIFSDYSICVDMFMNDLLMGSIVYKQLLTKVLRVNTCKNIGASSCFHNMIVKDCHISVFCFYVAALRIDP